MPPGFCCCTKRLERMTGVDRSNDPVDIILSHLVSALKILSGVMWHTLDYAGPGILITENVINPGELSKQMWN